MRGPASVISLVACAASPEKSPGAWGSKSTPVPEGMTANGGSPAERVTESGNSVSMNDRSPPGLTNPFSPHPTNHTSDPARTQRPTFDKTDFIHPPWDVRKQAFNV